MLASWGWRGSQELRCTPKVGQGWQIGKSDMTDYRCAPGLWEGAVVAQTLGVAIFARYTVMSGTPEKILELLLEAMRPDSSAHDPTETFLSDFLLTHSVFMPSTQLCAALLHQYPFYLRATGMVCRVGRRNCSQHGCAKPSEVPGACQARVVSRP